MWAVRSRCAVSTSNAQIGWSGVHMGMTPAGDIGVGNRE